MTTSVTEQLVESVRATVTAERLDPRANRERITQLAGDAVERYRREAAMGAGVPLTNAERVIERIVSSVCGHGAIESLFTAGGVEDIFIEGDRVTYFQDGRLRGLVEPTSEAENLHVITQLLANTDASLDRAHPTADGVQVLDGKARLTAAIPPASPHLSADIRLYVNRFATLPQLVESDTLNGPASDLLTLDVWAKGSMLICGETGSGKSTLLAAVLAVARENHCVRLCEESIELQFRPTHGGRYQGIAPGPDGRGGRSLRDLIKLMLRMRPDIIAVGEVRAEESWELARASRVGAGFLATIHANSAEDGLEALVLTALGAGPNITEDLVRRAFARSIDLVVHMERDDPNLVAEDAAYLHQVTEIRAVVPQIGKEFSSELIFERKDGLGSPLTWTGKLPPTGLVQRLERLLPQGTTLRDVLLGRAGLA